VTANRHIPAPPLLIRRALPAAGQDVAALLRDVPVSPQEVAGLLRQRGVLVLSDVTLPPAAPPVAAAAFRFDRPSKTAQLVGIGVAGPVRGRGLGRRLITGALMLLRADGFERVQAWAEPGGAVAGLLASAGFTASGHPAPAAGRCHFLLLL
jgi:ribosomal protein S18 acetylase RimI-like enzyme